VSDEAPTGELREALVSAGAEMLIPQLAEVDR
jgi:hypothetical protein